MSGKLDFFQVNGILGDRLLGTPTIVSNHLFWNWPWHLTTLQLWPHPPLLPAWSARRLYLICRSPCNGWTWNHTKSGFASWTQFGHQCHRYQGIDWINGISGLNGKEWKKLKEIKKWKNWINGINGRDSKKSMVLSSLPKISKHRRRLQSMDPSLGLR